MNAKPPTPQAISALLRKAGFQRSVSSASRIKGWRNYSPGYKVAAGYPDSQVEVSYLSGFSRDADNQRDRLLGEYAKAISAAGWNVAPGDGQCSVLIVTAPIAKENDR